jgi:hypothetical protein
MNDVEIDHGLKESLAELLEYGSIEEGTAAAGISRRVISHGMESLTPRQREIFERYVLEEYCSTSCIRCGSTLEYSELVGCRDKRYCSYCECQITKND